MRVKGWERRECIGLDDQHAGPECGQRAGGIEYGGGGAAARLDGGEGEVAALAAGPKSHQGGREASGLFFGIEPGGQVLAPDLPAGGGDAKQIFGLVHAADAAVEHVDHYRQRQGGAKRSEDQAEQQPGLADAHRQFSRQGWGHEADEAEGIAFRFQVVEAFLYLLDAFVAFQNLVGELHRRLEDLRELGGLAFHLVDVHPDAILQGA